MVWKGIKSNIWHALLWLLWSFDILKLVLDKNFFWSYGQIISVCTWYTEKCSYWQEVMLCCRKKKGFSQPMTCVLKTWLNKTKLKRRWKVNQNKTPNCACCQNSVCDLTMARPLLLLCSCLLFKLVFKWQSCHTCWYQMLETEEDKIWD